MGCLPSFRRASVNSAGFSEKHLKELPRDTKASQTAAVKDLPASQVASGQISENGEFCLAHSRSLPFEVLVKTSSGEVVAKEHSPSVQGDPIYRLIRKVGEGDPSCDILDLTVYRTVGTIEPPSAEPAGGFAEIYLAESLRRQEKASQLRLRAVVEGSHLSLTQLKCRNMTLTVLSKLRLFARHLVIGERVNVPAAANMLCAQVAIKFMERGRDITHVR